MDNTLVDFIEILYKQAEISKDSLDIHSYIANCVGACCYEYERTGDWDALNLWANEWKDKFAALLEK